MKISRCYTFDMETLRLYYPIKPFLINQGFGLNPDYYARFKDRFGNPEKGHMGVDLKAPHGTPVYASCDGLVHFERDIHGGEGMVIRTGRYAYKEGAATFNVIHWHLIGDTDPLYQSPIPTDGHSYPVKTGDLIGYADNTGAPFESSGDHLHMGLMPIGDSGDALEARNGFGGCIDLVTYFTGFYAQDYVKATSKLAQLVSILQEWVGLLSAKK